jgi:hypothetical protein
MKLIIEKKINGRWFSLYWNCMYGYNASVYIDFDDHGKFYEGQGTSFNKFTAIRNAIKDYKEIKHKSLD